jgi:GDP-4-dehydro-6-deoxy-D-mannose reductase
MPPRRVLLTGASGFVAGHLVPRLRAAFPDAELTLCGLGSLAVDVTDVDAVRALVRSVRPDACVHLAAVSTVLAARRDPGHAWRVNLHGSLALAAAALAHAPDCALLYVSSSEIYGRSFRAGIALDETALPAPMNTYAATKAAADLALGAMVAEGLRVIRLRPFNHTGPGQSADFVVPAFARQVARIEAQLQPPTVHVGALDPQRDFLDVRDVCASYVACLERADRIAPGTILNVASGTPRRIGDILRQLLELAGVTATLEIGAALLRPVEIPIAAGNAEAARAALGWHAAIPWEQTLRDVLQDWRERVRHEPSA